MPIDDPDLCFLSRIEQGLSSLVAYRFCKFIFWRTVFANNFPRLHRFFFYYIFGFFVDPHSLKGWMSHYTIASYLSITNFAYQFGFYPRNLSLWRVRTKA